MNSRRTGSALVVIALLAALGFLFWPRLKTTEERPASGIAATASPNPAGSAVAANPASAGITATTPAGDGERSELANDLNSPDKDIHSDLRVLGNVFDAFRSNFPQLGNPTGNNVEITAVLTGKNSLQLALIPRDHPAINARGQLCDRWGHPFFFHQLSGTQMEIRSAGPDKKFWTSDDVVLTP